MTWKAEDTAIARQQQPKHVLAAMNQHAAIEEMLESEHTTREELWEMVFPMQSMPRLYNENNWTNQWVDSHG